jgi:hypothetical protein
MGIGYTPSLLEKSSNMTMVATGGIKANFSSDVFSSST